MSWTTTPEMQQDCSGRISAARFNADYQYCMKNVLPVANVATFHSEENSGINWKNYQIGIEDPPMGVFSYATGCFGDSGSGQFITNGLDPKNDKFRFILAAIYSSGVGDKFEVNGVAHNMPCGANSFSHADTLLNGKKHYLQPRTISESITTPVHTLAWIKELAGI